MGIISTLLTGGCLVGKLCQGLSSAFSSNSICVQNGVTKIYDADLSVGGATFYSSNEDSPTEQYYNYVANPTTLPISLAMPNVDEKGGIEMLVPAKKSRPMSLLLDKSVAPSTELLIGPISDKDAANGGIEDTAVKLSLRSLPLNGTPVTIGGVTVSADRVSGLLHVSTDSAVIGNLTYFSATADSGLEAERRDTIIPQPQNEALVAGITRNYALNFGDMGFSSNDKLNCRLYFTIAGGNALRIEQLSKGSRPLPHGYLAYLQQRGLAPEE
ncbi:hypothetical protein [Oscillibacter sp.]|uniref:hypothetical protein n=1 Tax=Oscillibacter sp. TaxID=1945593 RepID=UPI00289FD482|nr:hypothetical protein [Oscillibacter sp.]